MMRVWRDGEAIVRDAIPPLPSRSLKAAISGNMVHVSCSNGLMLIMLPYTEYAREDGSGFTSAAEAKAYLDGEFAKRASNTQGPAGFGTVTPVTPARTIGTTFQPHATKAVLCIYSVKTQVTNPLLVGTSTATARLLSDAATTPTTERARVEATSGVGVTVTIALTTSNTGILAYLVPAGHYVRIAQTVSGTGAVSIVSQTEIVLG